MTNSHRLFILLIVIVGISLIPFKAFSQLDVGLHYQPTLDKNWAANTVNHGFGGRLTVPLKNSYKMCFAVGYEEQVYQIETYYYDYFGYSAHHLLYHNKLNRVAFEFEKIHKEKKRYSFKSRAGMEVNQVVYTKNKYSFREAVVNTSSEIQSVGISSGYGMDIKLSKKTYIAIEPMMRYMVYTYGEYPNWLNRFRVSLNIGFFYRGIKG